MAAVLPPDAVHVLRTNDMGSVNSICFHGGERLLAGTFKGSVFLYDLQTNRSSLRFEVGSEPITGIHHTSEQLITQSKGGTVHIWAVTNSGYVCERTVEGTHLGYCRTALHVNANVPDEQLLFYPCDENTIGVLHVHDPTAPIQLLVPNEPHLSKLGTVHCFKPFEIGSQLFLLAGYESGHFVTWEVSTGTIVDTLQLEADPMAFDYDPQTNRGIIGTASEKLTAISYQRQTMQLKCGAELCIKNPGVNCVRIRGDKKVFATGGWDGRIRIFSWKSLRPLAVLTEHKQNGVMDIAYSDAKVEFWHAPIMAAAGMDGKISLWDLYN